MSRSWHSAPIDDAAKPSWLNGRHRQSTRTKKISLSAPCCAALAIFLVAITGCDRFPQDPERTLTHVQGAQMHVGVASDPPFVRLRPGQPPQGREIAMLQAWADSLHAQIVWEYGGHADLLEALEKYKLQAVVGGQSRKSPWKGRVAFTKPYRLKTDDGSYRSRMLALPPGENAWLMNFEAFMHSRSAQAALGARQP